MIIFCLYIYPFQNVSVRKAQSLVSTTVSNRLKIEYAMQSTPGYIYLYI